ncbi:hypothetical protein [Amycolatopsis sp. NPDC051371]|uniref:hypothetical protein n=1 Tax=Amycolatopsis sp. NPDC051371 TaxID=3155800 RepID=UPI003437AC63
MSGTHRKALHVHAESVASLGSAYAGLAERHRAVADVVCRENEPVTAASEFGEWIFRTGELAAAAERLLALEIGLARGFGITWDTIAGALGVSRQAAWKRFARRSSADANSFAVATIPDSLAVPPPSKGVS